jgi:hypothetical protein
LLAVVVEEFGDVGADGGGFGGAAVEGVGGVAGAFVLVAGVEPSAGEGQQFALEVAADHIDVGVAGVEPDAEGWAAHRGDGGAVVVDLDRCEFVGEGGDLFDLAERWPGEYADSDAAAVRVCQRGVPVAI